MFTPVTNGNGYIYPKFDRSLETNPNILLIDAAVKEMEKDKTSAVFIYRGMENNPEAKAHLERINNDADLPFTQQLLRLGEVAKEYGSLNTAFQIYIKLLNQSNDTDARYSASLYLKDIEFEPYILSGQYVHLSDYIELTASFALKNKLANEHS